MGEQVDCLHHGEIDYRLQEHEEHFRRIDKKLEEASEQSAKNAVQIGLVIKTYWIILAAIAGSIVMAISTTLGGR